MWSSERVVAIAALVALASCAEQTTPELERLDPAVAPPGIVRTTLVGRNFYNRARRSLDSDEAEVHNRWQIALGGVAAEVTRRDAEHLDLVVELLTPGSYDLSLIHI